MGADARGRLWENLRGLLPADCHTTRIENEVEAGFPDIHYTYKGVSGTIELKKSRSSMLSQPFKNGGLRKAQIDWIEEEIEADGIVWIVAQVGRHIFVVHGMHAPKFNDYTVPELMGASTAYWIAGRYPAGTLENILLNKA